MKHPELCLYEVDEGVATLTFNRPDRLNSMIGNMELAYFERLLQAQDDDDVAAIREALADGTIDAIATDHAPHEPHTKEFPFDHAPPGMLGFETAFALAVTELGLPLERVVELMSTRPAEIAGIADRHGRPVASGNRANLAVVDLEERWTVSGVNMASRSQNTPYEGRELQGKVKYTIANGEVMVDEGVATQ